MATKVWLDRFVYNNTLRTVQSGPEKGRFRSSEERARQQGLEPWPPLVPPTLCLLSVGPASLPFLGSLVQLFPELRVIVFHPEEPTLQATSRAGALEVTDGLAPARRELVVERVGLAGFSDTCHAVSWSVDTPAFAFYKWAPLFASIHYSMALFNMNGCTPETMPKDADKYYCEYLFNIFSETICGKMEDGSGVKEYEEFLFPLVDTECGDVLCMCHTFHGNFRDIFRDDAMVCPGPGVEPVFAAQWGQDYFLYHNFFSEDTLAGKGVYVDVGASHPFLLSNSAFFDKCLGWRGACVEANPRWGPTLRALRTCEVMVNCAWSNTTQMKFGQGGELAALTNDDSLLPSEPFQVPKDSVQDMYFMAECRSLQDLLSATVAAIHGQGTLRRRIDLLSVDTEGAEIEIFKGFPFHEWDIRVIVIEASRQTAMALDSLLLPAGFLQVGVLGKDAVYASRTAVQSMRPGGIVLPATIQWNEPGTDEETTPYARFQRFFGVEGDLDADVGDQRLLNETEMARQAERLDRKHRDWLDSMREEIPSEEYRADFERAMSNPEVAALMREPRVKAALELLTENQTAWLELFKRDEGINRKMQKLMKEGVIKLA